MIDIILLALVAAFVALRLRSVLGTRNEFDEPEAPHHPEPQGSTHHEPAPVADLSQYRKLSGPMKRSLQSILDKDPSFDLGQFADGAKQAYGMILTSFWAGDLGEVEDYLDDDVKGMFEGAIEERNAQGFTVENRLIEIDDVDFEKMSVRKGVAEITLRFSSQIVSITRNATGDVVEGSMTDTVEVIDIWTFARDLESDDPNWLLVATMAE
ncbi:MAG: Tim44 domain-containing protein [Sphingomonadales bacterium]|nr:Tim44 domain-containing protein [Sphingomonadales bacterium]